jgi:hypothetical protein
MQLGDRRLSTQLSFDEIAQRGKVLQLLFDKYRGDNEYGLSVSQLVGLVGASGVFNKQLSEKEVINIFSAVKLATKSEIDYRAFEVRLG